VRATLSKRPLSYFLEIVRARGELQASQRELARKSQTLNAMLYLAETPRLHDGQWLYLPVGDRLTLRAVVALLELKLPPTVRTRLSRAA